MIIQTFDTIFEACTAAITTQVSGRPFVYRSATKRVLNYQDDPATAEVMWVLPFMATDSETKLGVRTTRMRVLLMFVINNYLADDHEDKKDVVDVAHDAFKEWRVAFETHAVTPRDTVYMIIDKYDQQDAVRSGIMVEIIFTVNSTVC